jgi:hypothetical protein
MKADKRRLARCIPILAGSYVGLATSLSSSTTQYYSTERFESCGPLRKQDVAARMVAAGWYAKAQTARTHKMKFQAYCPQCQIRVAAYTMLMGTELQFALHSDSDVDVIDATNIHHQWKLKNREKITLRDRIASGNLSTG